MEKRLANGKVVMPALLPTIFAMIGADRLFFPITDRVDAISADALASQKLFGRVSPSVAESQVVFFGAAFIAVPFNGKLDSGAFRERLLAESARFPEFLHSRQQFRRRVVCHRER